ncbi:MAG: SDR family oxidoreductase [Burkholderiales bacterium]|nr:SDR family oxidoreductase [Burkholderiales bacterium]
MAREPARSVTRRTLSRRLRRPSLLIVGCGDVGLRLLTLLGQRRQQALRVVAVTRRPEQQQAVRRAGGVPIAADLDRARSLRRLAAFADWAVLLAPPPANGQDDPRMQRLIAACSARGRAGAYRPRGATWPGPRAAARRWSYVSTTGVYGDCAGAWLDETRPVAPANARAIRRVAAERRLRQLGARGAARTAILRASGIYAHERLPIERLQRGTPALHTDDDVWTNHIHADDLARAAWLALFRGRPGRVVNAVDDSMLKMGDYFDAVADALALPRPPRLTRAEIIERVSPAMLSFMSESRRLANRRLKRELRLRLHWPTVGDTLRSLA